MLGNKRNLSIPDSVTSIGYKAFDNCYYLASVIFEDTVTWYFTIDYVRWKNKTSGKEFDVSDPEDAAFYLENYYYYYYWYKL